ncbi:Fur-regulated basic protein FbpA [Evansella sp. LMS18]|uniref:Fur-regulated basic protein FbpA n=1 Tax=Evansella sp. LMS18 TaxID=2924033 RepID=UPI0020D0449A|nr:Fur-regulated basic protein FbpA [Evansella sp. LMS18]UTR12773.1 Fur-regulated basic protein FbpA [Evansella sp. LMS18]
MTGKFQTCSVDDKNALIGTLLERGVYKKGEQQLYELSVEDLKEILYTIEERN